MDPTEAITDTTSKFDRALFSSIAKLIVSEPPYSSMA